MENGIEVITFLKGTFAIFLFFFLMSLVSLTNVNMSRKFRFAGEAALWLTGIFVVGYLGLKGIGYLIF